jgi:hypothetical protein
MQRDRNMSDQGERGRSPCFACDNLEAYWAEKLREKERRSADEVEDSGPSSEESDRPGAPTDGPAAADPPGHRTEDEPSSTQATRG